jgi:hypothetical protein
VGAPATTLWIALGLGGCGPLDVRYTTDKDDAAVEVNDTDARADTDPGAPTCAPDARADETVAHTETCAKSQAVTLQARVSLITPYAPWSLSAAPLEGNGDGRLDERDPMRIWWAGAETVSAIDGKTWAGSSLGGDRAVQWLTLGDVRLDVPGVEAVLVTRDTVNNSDYRLEVVSATGQLLSFRDNVDSFPWLADLEGDGAVEVLVGSRVLDDRLRPLTTLEGAPNENGRSVSADLDRDGTSEIIYGGYPRASAVLYAADGSRRATCWSRNTRSDGVSLVVGNLDADDDGEFALAVPGMVVKCDTDGSLIAKSVTSLLQPSMMGLAQLDEDPAPEFVIDDADRLLALDDDLSELWTWRWSGGAAGQWSWYPFALADFDHDGRHEVVVSTAGGVYVIDEHGIEIGASLVTAYGTGWMAQPVLADFNGDGLVEIAAPRADSAKGSVVRIDNDQGGWALPVEPWPGADHFPGDRGADGSIPKPSPTWLTANVWQGLAADATLTPDGAGLLPDLDVSVEVCVDGADPARVWARVSNVGSAPSAATTAVLEAPGSAAQTVAVPALDPGVATWVRFEGVAGATSITVTVDPDHLVVQCDPSAPTATWAADATP